MGRSLFSYNELKFIEQLLEDLESSQAVIIDDQEKLVKSIYLKIRKGYLNARIDPSLAGKIN